MAENEKNDAAKKFILTIYGRRYTVSGDSQEQFKRIEDCLNGRINQTRSAFSMGTSDKERILMLMAINLADDYLRATDELEKLKKKEEERQQALAEGTEQGARSEAVAALKKQLEHEEALLLALESENQELAQRIEKAEEKSHGQQA